jgi:hypothetical protein
MNQKLIENIDYTIDKSGNLVFTREYHLKRGHCCQSGCLNCPYKSIDPFTPAELNSNWSEDQDEYEEDLVDD